MVFFIHHYYSINNLDPLLSTPVTGTYKEGGEGEEEKERGGQSGTQGKMSEDTSSDTNDTGSNYKNTDESLKEDEVANVEVWSFKTKFYNGWSLFISP